MARGVNYGALRGKIIDSIPYKAGADHYQIEVDADGTLYRIAVDVYSQIAGKKKHFAPDGHKTLDTDRMVMYYKDENFNHPILDKVKDLPIGMTVRADLDDLLHLDYLRTSPALFPIDDMRIVAPKDASGSGDDLNDDIDPWVKRAQNNDNAEIFAFGSGWDDNAPGAHPETRPYFDPDPSLGIHDIHMNQGDSGNESKYNGVGQDGGLFIHFTDTDKWVAMFFRFQVQKTTTDDTTGDPI